jgi:hypothetical protein
MVQTEAIEQDGLEVMDLNQLILNTASLNIRDELEQYEKVHLYGIKNRFERICDDMMTRSDSDGDVVLSECMDIFYHGFGILWSQTQKNIFEAAVDSVLPRVFGPEWTSQRSRLMHQRGIKKHKQQLLIQMARRNGKTWVVSGICAALLLTVPGIKIAIFSVGERQSKMMKDEIEQRIASAWAKGSHSKKEDFVKIENNATKWVFQMTKTGTKQELTSLPGSSRVSFFFFWGKRFLFIFQTQHILRCVPFYRQHYSQMLHGTLESGAACGRPYTAQ